MKIIGVDLGGTKFSVGLIVNNKLKKIVSQKINAAGTQNYVINQVTNLIDEIFDKKVKSIGVGVPSIVDVKNGIVYETPNISSWKKVPLKNILERRYKVPVFLNNDANCFALGEKYFGICKNYNNIVALIIGTGIGAGIIINGKLYEGYNCGAGEFGEVIYKDHNFRYYCSGKYFKSKYKINGEDLFEMSKTKNKKAIKIFNEYGYHLGNLLSLIANSLDPEIIVLGGSVSKAYKFFKKSMKKSLKESTFSRVYNRLKIKVSHLNNNSILGAASLCYDKRLK